MKRLILTLCLVCLLSGCVTTWSPTYNVLFDEAVKAIKDINTQSE